MSVKAKNKTLDTIKRKNIGESFSIVLGTLKIQSSTTEEVLDLTWKEQ